jgi:hypothetical protein
MSRFSQSEQRKNVTTFCSDEQRQMASGMRGTVTQHQIGIVGLRKPDEACTQRRRHAICKGLKRSVTMRRILTIDIRWQSDISSLS